MPRLEQVRRRQEVEHELGHLTWYERLRVAALECPVGNGLAVRGCVAAEAAVDGAQLALGDVGDVAARIDIFEVDEKCAVAGAGGDEEGHHGMPGDLERMVER